MKKRVRKLISKYTVNVPYDFNILDAIEAHDTLEAQIERYITGGLFWEMFYSAISKGAEVGHIFHDVEAGTHTSYCKGTGFLSLKRHCFCNPSPLATQNPKKEYVRLFVDVVWANDEDEYGVSRNHMIDIPTELFSTKSKAKINGWIQSQRKWVKDIRDERAKKDAEEYIKGNPEVLKHIRKLAKEIA
jgi:hypothetical protein